MTKYFLVTTALFLSVLLLMSPSVFAASNTVQFTENTNVYLWGSGLTLVVVSESAVAEMTVNSDNVTFDMESGSSVTVRSNGKKYLTNNLGVQTDCLESYSQVSLTSNTTQVFTITPNPIGRCGGGGGGGAVFIAPPVAEEEEEEEEEVVVPTETVIGEATVTASEGGTVEATTEEGGTASLEMPAGAVTVDSEVTITPTETTAEAVATEVAALPSGESIVGGYVYSFAVEAAGETVTIFEQLVTVTLSYTDTQVSGLNEDSLTIYYYDQSLSQWVSLDSTVDTENNTVTASTAHFTLFALMVEVEEVEEEEEEVVTKPISEMTISELKAEIARISALITQLQTQLTELFGVTDQLTANLKYDDSGDQVELLQTWLTKDTSVYPEGIVSGWFGPLTKAAVVRFQEKYAQDVLTPWELTQGTGFVGSTTREKLNELYGGQ